MIQNSKEHVRAEWLAFMEGAAMPGYAPDDESAMRPETVRRCTPNPAAEERKVPVRVGQDGSGT